MVYEGATIVVKIIGIISLLLIAVNCNTTEPPISAKSISLTFEDVSSTEVWINLVTNNLQLPASLTRTISTGTDHYDKTINLGNQDTLLNIRNLQPNTNYVIRVYTNWGDQNGLYPVSSNELLVTTLDTTSHNFTWQTFEFGDHSSSVLYDVAIIDENNIWAVGKFYLNDSLGNPDTDNYNALHWDGTNWEPLRIPFTGSCSAVIYPIIRSVFAFSDNDIWFARGGSLVHYDGINYFNDCEMNSLLTGSINTIWGRSSSDLYIAGLIGNIVHYNGQNWQRIESGTDINLTDIFGTPDGLTVWTCGWDNNHTNNIILNVENNSTEIIWDGITQGQGYLPPILINTLWTSGGEFLLAGGLVVYKHSLLYRERPAYIVHIPTETGSKAFEPGNFVWRMRGTGKNNIFLAGDLGMLWHFNGASWYKYDEFYNQQFDRRFRSIDVKNNIVAAVGWKNSRVWVVLGEK
ncbi:MAG: hypothetical protein PVF17_09325 [Ignavibacteria bacterium]